MNCIITVRLYNLIANKMFDKVHGMLMGVALGDALGAPYEFNKGLLKEYNGKVDRVIKIRTRYQGTWEFPVGSVTDDTEMTLALANSLTKIGYYDRDDVVLSYMNWANSDTKSMGGNTRALFKGVKTIKGYESRYSKIEDPDLLQSNGALMRCTPLALFGLDELIADVMLTNPNLVAFWTNFVYINAVKMALAGKKIDLSIYIDDKNIIKPVRKVLKNVVNRVNINVSGKDKGWCLHALYVALKCFLETDSFYQAVNNAVLMGGDTDTNAAITGGLVGAFYGYHNMIQHKTTSKNIKTILASKNIRPKLYLPKQIERLAEKLSKMIENNMEFTTLVIVNGVEKSIIWKTFNNNNHWILQVGSKSIDITDYNTMSEDDQNDLVNVDIANAVDKSVGKRFVKDNTPIMTMLSELPAHALCSDPNGNLEKTKTIAQFYGSLVVDTDNWRYTTDGTWKELPSEREMFEGLWPVL